MSAVDFSKETVIIIVAFADGVNENDPASIRSDCPADSRHNGPIRLCVEKASSKNHKRDLWLSNPPVHAKLGHLGVCAPVLRKALAQAGMYYCSSVGSGSAALPQPRGRHAYARSGDSNIFANVPAAFVDHTRGSGAQAEF